MVLKKKSGSMVSVPRGECATRVIATMPSCSYTLTAGTVTPEQACATANLAPELTTRLAAGTACLGSQPSSIRMGSSFLPLTPPLALMVSMAVSAPAWICVPYWVLGPVMGWGMPILIVSAAWAAPARSNAPNAMATGVARCSSFIRSSPARGMSGFGNVGIAGGYPAARGDHCRLLGQKYSVGGILKAGPHGVTACNPQYFQAKNKRGHTLSGADRPRGGAPSRRQYLTTSLHHACRQPEGYNPAPWTKI